MPNPYSTRLQRTLWMALYLLQHRTITYDVVKETLGISERTYWRYMADLRDAGMMLNGNMGSGYKGTNLIAVDEWLAGVRAA